MQMLNSESESNIKRQSLVWKSHTAQAKKKKKQSEKLEAQMKCVPQMIKKTK